MNTKLKCLLLDDELPGLTYLKILCEQLPELDVVKAYNNPEIFLKDLSNLEFDICILDIEMPEINGLQIAGMLKGKPLIFTTAYKEYAAEAFDLDATDYIRKPVTIERLRQAVSKAKLRLTASIPSKPFIKLNTDKGKALIFFDQLCYIKTSDIDSRDKVAILTDGVCITLKNISFDKLKALLPANEFVRVNKKELIALRMVHAFSFNEIATNIQSSPGNVLTLALSEAYKDEFIKKLKI